MFISPSCRLAQNRRAKTNWNVEPEWSPLITVVAYNFMFVFHLGDSSPPPNVVYSVVNLATSSTGKVQGCSACYYHSYSCASRSQLTSVHRERCRGMGFNTELPPVSRSSDSRSGEGSHGNSVSGPSFVIHSVDIGIGFNKFKEAFH